MKGFEPPTYGLQIRCSTIELHQQKIKLFVIDLLLLTLLPYILKVTVIKSNILEKKPLASELIRHLIYDKNLVTEKILLLKTHVLHIYYTLPVFT